MDFNFDKIESNKFAWKIIRKIKFDQPNVKTVRNILKNFLKLVAEIISKNECYSQNIFSKDLDKLKKFVDKNKSKESLLCWYKFIFYKKNQKNYLALLKLHYFIFNVLFSLKFDNQNLQKDENIEIFIDESGNTGQLTMEVKKNNFNYDRHNQFFALCGIVLNSNSSKEILRKKYNSFKDKFKISNEIKGNELCTRARNDELNYFMNNILNNENFYIAINNKKFWISFGLLDLILEEEYNLDIKSIIAEEFLKEEDIFFKNYITLLNDVNKINLEKLIIFLLNYNYISNNWKRNSKNIFLNKCKFLLDNNYLNLLGKVEKEYIPNTEVLCSLLNLKFFLFFSNKKNRNENIKIIHHRIDQFQELIEKNINNKISPYFDKKIEVTFVDSQKEEIVQIADNCVSIFNHLLKECLFFLKDKKSFQENSWLFNNFFILLDKIGLLNLSLMLSPEEKAFIRTVSILFVNNALPNWKKFNFYYSEILDLEKQDLEKREEDY